ncbi:glycoside hydrolase family 32 protein, partial [Hungatella sp. SL.1.14]|nr:glycoside hydrolase family 32 protein [Hungatella sp. SL.1.14]
LPDASENKYGRLPLLPLWGCTSYQSIPHPLLPAVRGAYTRKIDWPDEAAEAGYLIAADLEEGDRIEIGGYLIYRKGNRICTDRSLTAGNDRDGRMQF